jgi:hypothetical protein
MEEPTLADLAKLLQNLSAELTAMKVDMADLKKE